MLEKVGRDEPGAFTQFFNLYYNQVVRFAYHYVREKGICFEIVTNVFFSLWQSRRKLPLITNMNAYLFIAVRNEVQRYAKEAIRPLVVSLEEIVAQRAEAATTPTPEEEALTREAESLLQRAIEALPAKCRTIFRLVHEEGKSVQEVARQLSVEEGTVRMQMKIARDKITKYLKPYFPALR
ncbi:MAG: sigma-70 family RNA polymerase sigma factor [Mediterranea sp.]|nr:sigma-70 family RNA polymerase sigma factor [Mediterranea sp.]